ncbi:ABC transporter substrate-binding protein [Halorussus halophilus]|uniref:ABC transporter substrate-binding protein n=1 Tax=Halorussus halophilus TaxID=2650975 RepID=UPI0013011685|nr:ABC transporter substrate-binding protein [Halorussus halophilus]
MTENNDSSDTLSRRKALQGIVGALGSASLAGCAKVTGKPSVNTLRYAQVRPPVTLDPVVLDEPWSSAPASQVFQGLYSYDRNLNLVPTLANSRPKRSDDGTTYTVELRDDARFQNGDQVRAKDVKYTYEVPVRQREEGDWVPTVWQVNMIRDVRTPDAHTVEFELKFPYPAFDHVLTRGIVPKSARQGNAEQFGTEDPVGSGPYEVEIFKPGKYAVLNTWDDYWGETTPPVEKVKFVANHAGLARSMSMKTGQNDVFERVEPKLWDATKEMGGSRLAATRSYNYVFVGFNCDDQPMSSPKVREAVDYLVSMDDFVKNVVTPPGFDQEGPTGARQHGPVPNHLAEAWNFPVEQWKGIPHQKNHDEAERLLTEAGVSNWSPKIAVPKDMLAEKLGESIVHGLRKVGFGKARVVKHSWTKFREIVTTGDDDQYAMFVGSWAGYDDPDTFLYPLFHEDVEGLTNGTYYSDEAVMQKIEAARRTTNRSERKQAYQTAIAKLLEDRVHLPGFTLYNTFGVKEHVAGFEPHPLSRYNPQLLSPKGAVSLQQ